MKRPGRFIASLSEPSLLRRGVGSVLLAFCVVWTVLLGYLYLQFRQASGAESGLQKFGNALTLSLAGMADTPSAAAAMAATDQWVNIRRKEIGRLPGVLLFELLAPDGQRLYASPALQGRLLDSPPQPLAETSLDGQPHHVYEGRGGRWTLRIAEPVRSTANFLGYNGRWLLPYLLLALPFILLAVWLSVRNSLRPLQQLADRIARRHPGDLQPVGFEAGYRELQPLVQALDALLQRLRDKLAHERSFVHDAAHEIRTPLAVINAQAHVLAHAPDAAQREQAQQHLDQAIARSSHLARQLLSLATLDAPPAAQPRELDLAQWLRQLLAQAAPAAMARRIELSLDAPDRLRRTADLPALESILRNLVDNAVRYGRAGGCVALTLRDDEGRISLKVQDDGPGIAPAEQARVFERFHRGAGHEAPGSGLGLAIVRQAAARMGGTVSIIEGLDGQGVGFFVSLPDHQHPVR
jgi:signal transduction histidine kinase